jgi:hypothetical protein
MNDPGYELPSKKILVVPHGIREETYFDEIIVPLKNMPKRDWFSPHAYYCLPLTVANQHGFLVKSVRDFDIIWNGSDDDVTITFINEENADKQTIKTGFRSGIVTIQNRFALKTSKGISLMTMQPPNLFIPGAIAMAGVIECDNIRRDFTFNLKVTVPNLLIKVRKGDPLASFMPIQRHFIDDFEIASAYDYFPDEIVNNDIYESSALSIERTTVDLTKNHQSGRRYFSGTHTDGSRYVDHQKKL